MLLINLYLGLNCSGCGIVLCWPVSHEIEYINTVIVQKTQILGKTGTRGGRSPNRCFAEKFGLIYVKSLFIAKRELRKWGCLGVKNVVKLKILP